MQAKTFSIIIAVAILFFIIDLIRRQKMTFKYSLFWLSSAALVIFFACNPSLVSKLRELAGFSLSSNFIFFLLQVFFIVVCLLLSVYANEQNSRAESLAQSIGILEYQIKELQAQLADQKKTPDSPA